MKRILAAMLALMMVLAMAGCNSSDLPDETTRPKATQNLDASGTDPDDERGRQDPTQKPGSHDNDDSTAGGPSKPDTPPDTSEGNNPEWKPASPHDSAWIQAEDAPEDLPGEKDFLDLDSVRMSKLLGFDVTAVSFKVSPVKMTAGQGLKKSRPISRTARVPLRSLSRMAASTSSANI